MDRPNIVFIMPEPIAANPDDTQLMRAAGRSRSGAPRKSWYAVQDVSCADTFHRLDAQLTRAIMRSVAEASFAGCHCTHSSSPEFGRPGWDRTYPVSWSDLYPD